MIWLLPEVLASSFTSHFARLTPGSDSRHEPASRRQGIRPRGATSPSGGYGLALAAASVAPVVIIVLLAGWSALGSKPENEAVPLEAQIADEIARCQPIRGSAPGRRGRPGAECGNGMPRARLKLPRTGGRSHLSSLASDGAIDQHQQREEREEPAARKPPDRQELPRMVREPGQQTDDPTQQPKRTADPSHDRPRAIDLHRAPPLFSFPTQ